MPKGVFKEAFKDIVGDEAVPKVIRGMLRGLMPTLALSKCGDLSKGMEDPYRHTGACIRRGLKYIFKAIQYGIQGNKKGVERAIRKFKEITGLDTSEAIKAIEEGLRKQKFPDDQIARIMDVIRKAITE